MSLDYDDIVRRARNERAFSNSVDYEMWDGNWCGRCVRDAAFREGKDDFGCPILAAALISEVTPAEWMEQPEDRRPWDAYHCIEFRAPGSEPPDPQPQPEPDGMDGLFPRPERQARMYVQPQPVEAPPSRVEVPA
jgi:hypothetical protein